MCNRMSKCKCLTFYKLFTTSKTNFILQYIDDAMLILNFANLEVIPTHKSLNKVV